MSDPVTAIAESEATGVIAEIFADIRDLCKVGVVSLIWRHLATIPGGLPWAWETVRPLYADGTIRREAAALRADLALPQLPAWPTSALKSVGLQDADITGIRTMLAAYDRTNPMALIALLALQFRLEGGRSLAVAAHRRVVISTDIEPDLPLPPLVALTDMSRTTTELVLAMNQLGAVYHKPVFASMYQDLARWPAYLALAWTVLAPLHSNRRLDSVIKSTIDQAWTRSQSLAAELPTTLPAITLRTARRVTRAFEKFTEDVIPRTFVICAVLRGVTDSCYADGPDLSPVGALSSTSSRKPAIHRQRR
jgi:hypothetical protein